MPLNGMKKEIICFRSSEKITSFTAAGGRVIRGNAYIAPDEKGSKKSNKQREDRLMERP
jgi:hypothetical protein